MQLGGRRLVVRRKQGTRGGPSQASEPGFNLPPGPLHGQPEHGPPPAFNVPPGPPLHGQPDHGPTPNFGMPPGPPLPGQPEPGPPPPSMLDDTPLPLPPPPSAKHHGHLSSLPPPPHMHMPMHGHSSFPGPQLGFAHDHGPAQEDGDRCGMLGTHCGPLDDQVRLWQALWGSRANFYSPFIFKELDRTAELQLAMFGCCSKVCQIC